MRKSCFSGAMAGMLFCGALAMAAPAPLIVSDSKTQFSRDGKHWLPAVPAWVHMFWPTVEGATWVWTAYKVSPDEAEHGSSIITFRRVFAVAPSAAGPAKLTITGDNAYEASFNGKLLGANGKLDAKSDQDMQFRALDTYDLLLNAGTNTLTVRAINYHRDGATPEGNPGGIVFKIMPGPPLAQSLADTGKAEIYGIHFASGKSVIKPDSKPVLDEIAQLLRAQPALKLEISGHTDNTGVAKRNQALSMKRAAAVVGALVKAYGIDPKRLQSAGYGDTRPIADNGKPDGRAKNRRVEITKLP